MHYALKRPSVEAVIFENAVLDPHATGRNMLSHAADALATAGRPQDARTVRRVAHENDTVRMWAGMDNALNLLPSRQSLYVYDPAFLGFYSRIAADSAIPDARWAQGTAMALAMVSDRELLAHAWNRMSALSVPTLVVRGESDPATSPEELALMRAKPNVEVVEVPRSGHFIHVEQPHAFAALIADWHRGTFRRARRG